MPTIFANQSLVEAARSKQISVWIYGSDDELDHAHFAGRAIRGLIVDDPETAMACFEVRSPIAEQPGAEQDADDQAAATVDSKAE